MGIKVVPTLTFLQKKCTGCRSCELICAYHHYEVNNPKKARLRIMRHNSIYFQIIVCKNCERPSCLEICESGAIFKGNDGVVHVLQDECIQCMECVYACTNEAVFFHRDIGIIKCDLCGVCVENCPNGALIIE